MLTPTKHEDLKLNLLVVGADLLRSLGKESKDIEALFGEVRKEKDLGIETFFDTLLFLWLSNFIAVDEMAFLRRLK